jgi:hypothetical protein
MWEAIYPDLKITEVAQDIFHTKFLTPAFAEAILDCCKENGKWTDEKFEYSTRDIYLEETFPDLFSIITSEEKFLNRFFDKLLYTSYFKVYTAFVIKYSLGDQTKLDMHHDDSYITGAIKLNNDYTGGEMWFPRQKFSNKDTQVGDLLLFPGEVTHPHRSTPLKSGEKYSLIMWTREDEKHEILQRASNKRTKGLL